jgi:hypothetical protein
MSAPTQRHATALACGLIGLLLAVGQATVPADHAAARGSSAPRDVVWPVIQVSHDRYPAHAEPSLAVNPRNPRNLLGAAQLFGPRQNTVGTFVSLDGGQTWRDNGSLPLPRGTNWADDVTVAFDAGGTGFVAAMATVQTAAGLSHTERGVYVWRTADGGRSFAPPVTVESGHFADHPWLAAESGGPTRSGGSPTLYVAWSASPGTDFDRSADGLAFSRSVDGGRHFSAARIISTPPFGVIAPVVAPGPAGAVYVAFERGLGGADAPAAVDPDAPQTSARHAAPATPAADAAEMDTQAEVVASTDHGQHFGPPRVLGPMAYLLAPAPGLSVPASLSMAVDQGDGTVTVAYTAPRGAILVARSHTAGRTWDAPVRLTAGLHGDQATYFQPQVVVDRPGTVDVTYFALLHGRVDAVLARSTTQGVTFPHPLRLTPAPFDPALATLSGRKYGAWWIGDYQGLAAGGGVIHPVWNDTRSGRLEIVTTAVPTIEESHTANSRQGTP